MRYKITFSYDGSCFYGYERQPGLKTVVEEIEKILSELNNKKVTIHASGRTDKGVHALNQVAHFDLDKTPTLYGLKKLLNKRLNNEIYIKDISIVDDNFHARYDVLEKTYVYYINTKEYNVFARNYCYQYNKDLDTKKMREAIKYFLGKHDFRSFCKESKIKENCVREIKNINLEEKYGIIIIKFTADGFLRKMVRNMVGLLVEIGSNKKDISSVEEYLENKCSKSIKSVPGCGLYLESVLYKE